VNIDSEFHANSILGSIGLVIVVVGALWAVLKRTVSPVLRFLGIELGLILFYCMVGGGGLIVSLLVGSIIRSTNCFAIYAIFIGVLASVWGMQLLMERLSWRKSVRYVMGAGVLIFCLVCDSPIGTNPTKYAPFATRLVAWQSEQTFFGILKSWLVTVRLRTNYRHYQYQNMTRATVKLAVCCIHRWYVVMAM
jgi:hypothetical protein